MPLDVANSDPAASLARAGAPEQEFEILPAMIEAGEDVVLSEIGGADLGGYFSARDLAGKVYLAMVAAAALTPAGPQKQNPKEPERNLRTT
jgi:hypothetical protein